LIVTCASTLRRTGRLLSGADGSSTSIDWIRAQPTANCPRFPAIRNTRVRRGTGFQFGAVDLDQGRLRHQLSAELGKRNPRTWLQRRGFSEVFVARSTPSADCVPLRSCPSSIDDYRGFGHLQHPARRAVTVRVVILSYDSVAVSTIPSRRDPRRDRPLPKTGLSLWRPLAAPQVLQKVPLQVFVWRFCACNRNDLWADSALEPPVSKTAVVVVSGRYLRALHWRRKRSPTPVRTRRPSRRRPQHSSASFTPPKQRRAPGHRFPM